MSHLKNAKTIYVSKHDPIYVAHYHAVETMERLLRERFSKIERGPLVTIGPQEYRTVLITGAKFALHITTRVLGGNGAYLYLHKQPTVLIEYKSVDTVADKFELPMVDISDPAQLAERVSSIKKALTVMGFIGDPEEQKKKRGAGSVRAGPEMRLEDGKSVLNYGAVNKRDEVHRSLNYAIINKVERVVEGFTDLDVNADDAFGDK